MAHGIVRRILAALVVVLLGGDSGASASTVSGTGDSSTLGDELIFADGFESGDFTAWDRAPGAPPGTALPPDPAETAPDYDPTVAIDPYEPNIFIFQGPDPIQFEVEPGAVDPRRICLVRGRVLDRAGEPIRGVRVTVHGVAELGFTFTRPDGVFDLALNGGGAVDLDFRKSGYLGVARRFEAPSADWTELEDVVLIPLDSEVTEIPLGQTVMQVARGSVETDADGSRQATLMFPADTTAEIVMPDGSTVPLSVAHVRATEYTVGATGAQAMPGTLPIGSGYTYAVEFSVDEAIAVGAVRVDFDQPIATYLENFLGFPVGEHVPAGYFDRQKAEWIGSPDGRVIEILSVTGGLADLDVDGSGTPADPTTLDELGITEDERQRLALLYSIGQELWRVPVPHFTPWDYNWPYGPPDDAVPPPDSENVPQPPDDPPPADPDATPEDGEPEVEDPDCVGGSIIECQSQLLRESVGLVGVPYRLHYSSDRVLGRETRSYFKVRVSGPTLPASLLEMRLVISAAGRRYEQTFPPTPDLVHEVSWDRFDRFDRPLHAETPVTIRIEYVYALRYYSSRSSWDQSFSRLPNGSDGGGTILPSFRQGFTTTLFREIHTTAGDLGRSLVGSWDITGERLGGWTFGVHHRYSPRTRTLLLGTGERRFAHDVGTVAPRHAGTGESGDDGDGGPARLARLMNPEQVALGPDGSLYVVDSGAHRVRRVAPDGTISNFAGNGIICSDPGCGDGMPATDVPFSGPAGVAVAPDGSVLIADHGCVRRVGLDGIIETVADVCCEQCGVLTEPEVSVGGSCDNCPALDTELIDARAVAISPGGGYYIADAGSNQVRFVGADGFITTLAGDGTSGSSGDGGPAIDARLSGPTGVAVNVHGEVLISDTNNHRIRAVGRDGTILTVAGTGTGGYAGDGGLAVDAELFGPAQIAAAPDGSFLIADEFNQRVRRVTSGGQIETVVGTAASGPNPPSGGLALQIELLSPRGVAVERSGTFYVADSSDSSVLQVTDARPVERAGQYWIPSGDGQQVWVFDERGRHLETKHALTGITLLAFAYDSSGLIETITDADGNVTTVQRGGSGIPTAIVGPYGQTTQVVLDSLLKLEGLTDPEGNSWGFDYTLKGLLTSIVDPNTHETIPGYSTQGRLTSELDAAGGMKTFGRQTYRESGLSWSRVRFTSEEDKVVDYETWEHRQGERRWTTIHTGLGTEIVTRQDRLFDGTRVVRRPDGSLNVVRQRSDPLWGAQVTALDSSSFETPNGVGGAVATATDVELVDPLDPLSLVSRSETRTINGRVYAATYDALLRRWTLTSPEGRERVIDLDTQGRPTSIQHGGFFPVSFSFDTRGRLDLVQQGAGTELRILDFIYDTLGRLETVTDPLLRQSTFTYDDANRVETQTLPGNRLISFGWDSKGNLTALTPPGRPVHAFTWTPVDNANTYEPPAVGSGIWSTEYDYDLDQKISQILRPDGLVVAFSYDEARRLESITSPRGTATFSYDPDSGHIDSIATPDGDDLSFEMDGPLLTSTSWSGEVTGSVGRTYDNDLRLESISVNGADPILYDYDDDGLVIQAGDMELVRDPETGFLSDTTLGVISTHYDYSDFGELESITASVSGSPIFVAVYIRDDLGRITTKTETIQGTTTTSVYGYDPAGRLDTVSIDSVLVANYDYDDNGNRLLKTTPGGSEAGSYDDQDRMVTYGGADFTYTRNGELLTRTDSFGTTTFDYDVFGNLRSVILPDSTEVQYSVDGRNRRIARRVDGVTTHRWLWQGQLSPIAELDAANAVVSRYVYATRTNVPDYMLRGGSVYRIIHDHLGSPRLVLHATTGAVAQRIDYDEWGVILQDTNPGWIPFGFAGGMYEPAVGLLRFGFRDVVPAAGRATSKDPIGHASGNENLFSWSNGDPVNRTDVYGLAQKCSRPLASIGGILSALYPGPGASERAERYNREPLHEQFWFDDGSNAGYFKDSLVRPDEGHDRSEYLCEGRLLDDATLLEAIANKSEEPGEYELMGPEQNNCQDWASEVMMEYERLRAEKAKATGLDPETEYVWGRVLTQP